jgi:N-acyl-D-amino-acid deacylase
MLDILLQNGVLVDGSGCARYPADVGIAGDRIEVIGRLPSAQAVRVIDVAGMMIAPGFIDMHSHADYTLPVLPTADSKVHQGFTLEVVGNCGQSPAPLNHAMRQEKIKSSALGGTNMLWPGMRWDWDSFGDFLLFLQQLGTSVNVAPLVGHGTIRTMVMGEGDGAPDAAQMEAMKAGVRKAFAEGALGLSTGLIYPPGIYARTDEIVALAQVAAEADGIYTTHIRGEGDTLLEAIAEAIEIGRRAHVRTEISHLKAAGKRNWHKMSQAIQLIEAARAEGLDVTADMYPYTAANTYMVQRLGDAEYRARVRESLAESRNVGDADWDKIYVSYCPRFPAYEGRTSRDIASERGQAPEDAVLDILVETQTQAELIVFMMSEENVALGLRQPYVMLGSDGEGRSAQGPLSVGKPNPRNYGTCARMLGHYVRERAFVSLEEAVRRMTALPAARLKLRERGLVKPGNFADLVVFDPMSVADVATFEHPHRYPPGIAWVLVNGKVVIAEGQHTGVRPGRVVTR